MAIAISPRDQTEFVTKADRELPPEQRTVFLLRPLTNVQRKLIEDQSLVMDGASGQAMPRMGSVKIEAVRACLIGCRNFCDVDGSPVEFQTEGKRNVLGVNVEPPSPTSINRLHPSDLAEIVDEIMAVSRTTVDEGKG